MASKSDRGSASEPPTPKRLRDARRRGECARSADVVALGSALGAGSVIAITWPSMVDDLGEFLRLIVYRGPSGLLSLERILSLGLTLVLKLSALPLLGAAFGALAASYMQVGSIFSFDPIQPKLERLNPLTNAQSIFGKKALYEVLRGGLKVFGIGYLVVLSAAEVGPRIFRLTRGLRPGGAGGAVVAREVAACISIVAEKVLIFAFVLGIADWAYQRFAFRKRMKMTKEEVKRETKEAEGDPQHKADRQRVHREMSEERMLDDVALADCVIINPTRLAVAIRFNQEEMDAPVVVARGRRLVAEKIRKLARQHNIPIVRNVDLARALVELELDDEIPGELYETVAEVLRFVYDLDRTKMRNTSLSG